MISALRRNAPDFQALPIKLGGCRMISALYRQYSGVGEGGRKILLCLRRLQALGQIALQTQH